MARTTRVPEGREVVYVEMKIVAALVTGMTVVVKKETSVKARWTMHNGTLKNRTRKRLGMKWHVGMTEVNGKGMVVILKVTPVGIVIL